METSISMIADLCGIIGFIISLFAIRSVNKIKKEINSNKITLKDSSVSGDFVGRDRNA